MNLRSLRAWALALALAVPGWAQADYQIVDELGRTIRLEAPASRLIFSEPGDFGFMALLVESPAQHIVGWNRWRLDAPTLEHWRSLDPDAFDQIEQMALDGPQSLNVEALIALEPDLVVFDHFFGTGTQAIQRLEKAGIPVAVLTLEPDLEAANPTHNLEQLAVLLDRTERGQEVGEFMRQRIQRIQEGVSKAAAAGLPPPRVLMEPHAGRGPCCLAVGRNSSMGKWVKLAGGDLVGHDMIDETSGQLSAEYVIASDPEVYIATGGPYLAHLNGMILGTSVSPEEARASLERVVSRTGVSQTQAMATGRIHGLWHSGLSIVNLERIAKWLYPDEFTDVDPSATMAEINQRFFSRPLPGTFWVSLHPESP